MHRHRTTICLIVIALAAAFSIGYLAGGGSGLLATAAAPGAPSGNGDVNADGKLDLTDPIHLLSHLFLGGEPPVPIPACPAAETLTAIVVRHCEKDDTVSGDAPLSAAGRARAARLRDVLARAYLDEFLATEYDGEHNRTVETLAPAAEDRALEVRVVEAGAMADALRALPPGTVAAVAGNRQTVPSILAGLGVKEGVVLGSEEYDSLWVVRFGATAGAPATLVRLRY